LLLLGGLLLSSGLLLRSFLLLVATDRSGRAYNDSSCGCYP
jgi:hypothetical protein